VAKSKPVTSPAGGSAVQAAVILRPFAPLPPDERPRQPLVSRGRDLGGRPVGGSGPTADRDVLSHGMIGR
jgi:hypothetical protein